MVQNLGTRIVYLRRQRGLTQEKLANAAGLKSKGYLSRIERGERLPSLTVLSRLAESLGVEVRDLLTYPDAGEIPRAMDLVRLRGPEFARTVCNLATSEAARAPMRPVHAAPANSSSSNSNRSEASSSSAAEQNGHFGGEARI